VSARNLVYEALALRARESPGGSRILTLMTAEAGLVDVFVFGGPKSRLRSLASPYASGRAFVYLDPVKDFQKLSDFDVRESYPALRDELGRLWAAGLVAELLIKTSGGGGDYPASPRAGPPMPRRPRFLGPARAIPRLSSSSSGASWSSSG
jgi:DNA repair protein RecO (recombination protein O)